ncbi:FabG-like 3-oxoacyl-(acyl-carrier-protein) reductase [Paraconexibacter sp. AEG42_29]|uniref:FabG-like 3-oxoacyl-(Acyl-carrier-protein) reductase n=1 Tax=Paraconexibacter sp. AEG42_29 TaxID=2997339 RepID=A0AAU7B2R6_9ACTN
MEIDGRRFIVAGATGAVGGALARELAARGAEVGLLGRDRTRLDAVAEELGGVPTATFDARDATSCALAVDAVAAAMQGVDGVVVAIGAVAFGAGADTPDEVTAELIAVNATGPIALLRAGAAHLEPGGCLAAVTAMVADYPTAGMASYSASKAALSAYLVALRRELRRGRIAVIDARLPHLDTTFADHALAGEPPAMPTAHSSVEVVRVLVDAIEAGRRELSWDLKAAELRVA